MAEHPAHRTAEHLAHAKLHETRLTNAAAPGRHATAEPRSKTADELALQADVNAKILALEDEIGRLPDNPMRERAIHTLENVTMWVEYCVTYTPVIVPG